MRSLKKLAALCVTPVLAAAMALPALPQEPAAQGPTIKTSVNLVNLFVTVRDKSKRIVTDLKQDDFKIAEDNQDQKIAFFSKEVTLPDHAGVAHGHVRQRTIHAGCHSRRSQQLSEPRDAQRRRSDDHDVRPGRGPAVRFHGRPLAAQPRHSQGANQHGRRWGSRVTPGTIPQSGSKGTNFYDALYLACNEKLSTEAGRKAIVVLTDAEDNGSKVRVEEAIEAAQRTDTVVHILLVYDPHYGANASIAKKITDETGGRMIVVNNEKHLQEAFDQISEELRSQYTLGYYPTNSARDGKFRKIKIDLANHDLKVLARKGYYAPKS